MVVNASFCAFIVDNENIKANVLCAMKADVSLLGLCNRLEGQAQ